VPEFLVVSAVDLTSQFKTVPLANHTPLLASKKRCPHSNQTAIYNSNPFYYECQAYGRLKDIMREDLRPEHTAM
jgi:hypothetical protein